MLVNLHTHTTYCDGSNTPKEIISCAIESGFDAIGFSGHGYTPYDLSYCMKKTDEYISEITSLKEKYKGQIQVYLGIEEDTYSLCNREDFDYIIGSSHYLNMNNEYFTVDSSYDYFKKCLELFDYDPVKLADVYYSNFCEYIKTRKPDIVGHFDLITKFDEQDSNRFANSGEYIKKSQNYIKDALKSGSIFEVNTGVMSRGYRDYPYPSKELLYVLLKEGGKVTLSSDSHNISTLSYGFEETRKMLKDIGFEYVYAFYNGEFVKDYL